MYKRSSDMKALAVTLDLAKKKQVPCSPTKEGYEEKAEDDSMSVVDEEETSAITTSGKLINDFRAKDSVFFVQILPPRSFVICHGFNFPS